MPTGIKETMEVLASVEIAVDKLNEALEDGSLDWKDTLKIIPVITSLKAGIEGIGQIPEEIKDIDKAELQTVLASFASISMKMVKLITGVATLK